MSPQKKILIIGAGIFSIPLIKKAKELGHFVIAIHPIENELGFKFSDKNYICDANQTQEILKIARDEKIDGIATISEYAAKTTAYIARELNLPGFDYPTAEILSNKFLLREVQAKINIQQPNFGFAKNSIEAKHIFERLQKPVIVKPINSCGSRGVFKANHWEEVEQNIDKSDQLNFNESGIIMEEYLEGIELGGGVLLKNFEVFILGITRKLVDENFIPYVNILPAYLDKKDIDDIKEVIQKIARELNIKDTYLNVNMILTKDGPRILELGGRLAGNSSPEITKLISGVDPYEYVINFSLGIKKEYFSKEQSEAYAAYIIGSKNSGIVKSIQPFESVFPNKNDSFVKSFFTCKQGDRVSKMESSNDILGFLILKDKNTASMLQLIKEVKEINWIVTEYS